MALKKRYYSLNGQILGEHDVSSGQTLQYARDALGNVRKTIDSDTGNVVHSYIYKPWGEIWQTTGTGATSRRFCWIGSWGYANTNRHYQFNSYYVRARHYSGVMGAWMTRDPLWPMEMPYGYVNGRVYLAVDPSGMLEAKKIACGNKTGKLFCPQRGKHCGFVVGAPLVGNRRPAISLEEARKCLPSKKNCVAINGSLFSGSSGPLAKRVCLPECGGTTAGIGNPKGVDQMDTRYIQFVHSQGSERFEQRLYGRRILTANRDCKDEIWQGQVVGSAARPRTFAFMKGGNLCFAIFAKPGLTGKEVCQCVKQHADKGSYGVALDGGRSTQAWNVPANGKPQVIDFPHQNDGGNTRLDNWVFLCDC
ncbi:MAG: hypothetical protein KDC26_07650 [Armatimonadetes bacterium]|nr:hypothetical protein [Armatimonadota bacterium]